MYKLFLTLRYLTRKAIVIFPILVVWLCVSMMIIVASIMGGFVDHVKQANRDLLGDVIISTKSGYGFPNYEDLQAKLATLKNKDGQKIVEVSTPLIKSYGLINFPNYGFNGFAQIVGVDPAGRAASTGFRQTLYRQFNLPAQVADLLAAGQPDIKATTLRYVALSGAGVGLLIILASAGKRKKKGFLTFLSPLRRRGVKSTGWSALLAGIVLTASASTLFPNTAGLPDTGKVLAEHAQKSLADAHTAFTAANWALEVAQDPILATIPGLAPGSPPATSFSTAPAAPPKLPDPVTGRALDKLKDSVDTAQVNLYLAQRVQDLAATLDQTHSYTSAREIAARLTPKTPSFDIAPEVLAQNNPANPPSGCIPAAGIGMYTRDRHGDFIRPPELENLFCELTVVPISRRGMTIEPQHGSFIVVDDSYTQVIDVDSTYVFAPFAKVQQLALMDAGPGAGGVMIPARCTEIQIKTAGHDASGIINPQTLLENRDAIDKAVNQFLQQPEFSDTFQHGVQVETWDQKQALYIAAVENEKSLITFILGLMSLVVVVVIFLIFYMIVRDKTRDIGIIKALGGSESGVMAIFMLYGTFIGVVGGLAGALTGVVFVWNTNFIHDKIIYGIFGVMIWRRDIYLFDKIPDTVHNGEVIAYVIAAIIAGFLGATLPAILAARQDPVKAVRFE